MCEAHENGRATSRPAAADGAPCARLRPAEQPGYGDDDDRAHYGDQQAGQVEPRHALGAEPVEDPPADDRPDDAEDDVDHHALAAGPHDDAGDPARERSEDDPQQDVHALPPSLAAPTRPLSAATRNLLPSSTDELGVRRSAGDTCIGA